MSFALLAIPRLAPICEMAMTAATGETSPMRCYYTYRAELLISLSALIVSGSLFFVRGAEGRRLSGLFLVLLGALAILLPQSWIIGICPKGDAPCHLTYAWTLAGGIILIAIGTILAWLAPLSVAARAGQPAPLEKEGS